jgi:hypothetical protein
VQYVNGHGNLLDLFIILLFLLAFAFRCEALFGGTSRQAVELMVGLLASNLVLCCFRFLLMLSMIPRIGVMVIITIKIVVNDILPFIVFAATIIAAFEAASIFFSWMLKEDHQAVRRTVSQFARGCSLANQMRIFVRASSSRSSRGWATSASWNCSRTSGGTLRESPKPSLEPSASEAESSVAQ